MSNLNTLFFELIRVAIGTTFDSWFMVFGSWLDYGVL